MDIHPPPKKRREMVSRRQCLSVERCANSEIRLGSAEFASLDAVKMFPNVAFNTKTQQLGFFK